MTTKTQKTAKMFCIALESDDTFVKNVRTSTPAISSFKRCGLSIIPKTTGAA